VYETAIPEAVLNCQREKSLAEEKASNRREERDIRDWTTYKAVRKAINMQAK